MGCDQGLIFKIIHIGKISNILSSICFISESKCFVIYLHNLQESNKVQQSGPQTLRIIKDIDSRNKILEIGSRDNMF